MQEIIVVIITVCAPLVYQEYVRRSELKQKD